MAIKKWIQSMKMKEGALTLKAKQAGLTIDEYCAKDNLDLKSKRQCTLYKTLQTFRKK